MATLLDKLLMKWGHFEWRWNKLKVLLDSWTEIADWVYLCSVQLKIQFFLFLLQNCSKYINGVIVEPLYILTMLLRISNWTYGKVLIPSFCQICIDTNHGQESKENGNIFFWLSQKRSRITFYSTLQIFTASLHLLAMLRVPL